MSKKYVIGLRSDKMYIEVMTGFKSVEDALNAVVSKYDNRAVVTFIYSEDI